MKLVLLHRNEANLKITFIIFRMAFQLREVSVHPGAHVARVVFACIGSISFSVELQIDFCVGVHLQQQQRKEKRNNATNGKTKLSSKDWQEETKIFKWELKTELIKIKLKCELKTKLINSVFFERIR